MKFANKNIKKNIRNKIRNKQYKSILQTFFKKLINILEFFKKDIKNLNLKKKVFNYLALYYQALDKAVNKNIIHKNCSNKKKSRITKLINSLLIN
jgi:ribosomal protein S20